MKNGNFIKARWRFLKEKFKTKQGLADIFIGSFIWGIVVIKFNEAIFASIDAFFRTLIPITIISDYLSYLIFGLILSVFGVGISYLTVWIYEQLRKAVKKLGQ